MELGNFVSLVLDGKESRVRLMEPLTGFWALDENNNWIALVKTEGNHLNVYAPFLDSENKLLEATLKRSIKQPSESINPLVIRSLYESGGMSFSDFLSLAQTSNVYYEAVEETFKKLSLEQKTKTPYSGGSWLYYFYSVVKGVKFNDLLKKAMAEKDYPTVFYFYENGMNLVLVFYKNGKGKLKEDALFLLKRFAEIRIDQKYFQKIADVAAQSDYKTIAGVDPISGENYYRSPILDFLSSLPDPIYPSGGYWGLEIEYQDYFPVDYVAIKGDADLLEKMIYLNPPRLPGWRAIDAAAANGQFRVLDLLLTVPPETVRDFIQKSLDDINGLKLAGFEEVYLDQINRALENEEFKLIPHEPIGFEYEDMTFENGFNKAEIVNQWAAERGLVLLHY